MWREKKVEAKTSLSAGLFAVEKLRDINDIILKDLQKTLAALEQKSHAKIIALIHAEIEQNRKQADSEKHLRRINKIVADHLGEMKLKEKQALPRDAAWFCWKFSQWERMRFHYQQPSNQAYSLSHLAQIAIGVTNRMIARDGMSDVKNNELVFKDWHEKSTEFVTMRKLVDKIYKKKFMGCGYDPDLVSVKIALATKLAEVSQLGNCGEKVWVLTHFLKKLGLDIRVEHFQIMCNAGSTQTNGNHTFIVLGRDEESDPSDYTTWGINAIICDPWSRQQYFVRDIPQLLNDCIPVQYQYALLPAGDFKPAVNKIYFQKQGNDLNYYFTDIYGDFRKKIIKDVHFSETLVVEDIIPLFNGILTELDQNKLIFEKIIIKHYEKAFHPFANGLKLLIQDSIKILKAGLEIYYADPYFGLEHGLNTHNFELIEQSLVEILKYDQEFCWEIFESLDLTFKQTCFKKLFDLAIQEQNKTIALKLLQQGYGDPAQITQITGPAEDDDDLEPETTIFIKRF